MSSQMQLLAYSHVTQSWQLTFPLCKAAAFRALWPSAAEADGVALKLYSREEDHSGIY